MLLSSTAKEGEIKKIQSKANFSQATFYQGVSLENMPSDRNLSFLG